MKMNKKSEVDKKLKIEELIDFFELRNGYNMREVVEDMVDKIGLLNHETMGKHTLSMDECDIQWGESGHVCMLDEFVEKYTDKLLEGVLNVIKSYLVEQKESIDE